MNDKDKLQEFADKLMDLANKMKDFAYGKHKPEHVPPVLSEEILLQKPHTLRDERMPYHSYSSSSYWKMFT